MDSENYMFDVYDLIDELELGELTEHQKYKIDLFDKTLELGYDQTNEIIEELKKKLKSSEIYVGKLEDELVELHEAGEYLYKHGKREFARKYHLNEK